MFQGGADIPVCGGRSLGLWQLAQEGAGGNDDRPDVLETVGFDVRQRDDNLKGVLSTSGGLHKRKSG